MDMVDQSGTGADDIAKCLSTVRVNVADSCAITIAAPAAGGSFVDALWTTSTPEGADRTYSQYRECPTATSTPVLPITTPVPDIMTALNSYIYGGLRSSNLTSIALPAPGKVVITRGAATWAYAIRVSSGITAAQIDNHAVVSAGATLTLDTHFKIDLAAACPATRFGVVVGNIKLCPLCPAGSLGNGYGCTPCAAGTQSALGGTCVPCAPGTYAGAGVAVSPTATPTNNKCLPCPAGTYSGVAAGECTEW